MLTAILGLCAAALPAIAQAISGAMQRSAAKNTPVMQAAASAKKDEARDAQIDAHIQDADVSATREDLK